jgi:DNA-binding NtrC family response regulator
LAVFEISLPSLRERDDDILLLADAFLKEVGATVGRPSGGISDDARDQLLKYPWPGNVRELRNAIERAVILCGGGLVASDHLSMAIARAVRPASNTTPVESASEFPADGVNLDAIERDLVNKALARARNNKSQAAKLWASRVDNSIRCFGDLA